MTNTAFSSVSSNLLQSIALYDLGLIVKGTPKVYKVQLPAAANTGVPTTQKCKIYLQGFITDLEGTNQELTISMKNLTSGSGVIKENTYVAADEGKFYTTVTLDCIQGDIIEFTFTYTADEALPKATITAFAYSVIA